MAKSRELYKVTEEKTYQINPEKQDNLCDISRLQSDCLLSNNNLFHPSKHCDPTFYEQFYGHGIANDDHELDQIEQTHSNLIDLYSPPNSPSIKVGSSSDFLEKKLSPAFRYSSSTSDIESLTEEFSLLTNKVREEITIGSLVEVSISDQTLVGTVRWCGRLLNQSKSHQIVAGIELGQEIEEGTDGSCSGHQYFICQPGKGVFVPKRYCKKYALVRSNISCPSISSVLTSTSSQFYEPSLEMEHGGPDCPPVTGQVAPIGPSGDVSQLAGKFRGIQGHHNSCYLDATLFSMFTFTSIFDCLLFRPPTREDIPQYDQVQRILREEIVNPLRQHYYVRADKVMKLRRLLQKLSSVTGLTTEEKDPEEFLHCLLSQTLRAEPFLKLSSGQEAYHHQLFVEKDEKLIMPTVQQLFEQSFLASGIKLKEVSIYSVQLFSYNSVQ